MNELYTEKRVWWRLGTRRWFFILIALAVATFIGTFATPLTTARFTMHLRDSGNGVEMTIPEKSRIIGLTLLAGPDAPATPEVTIYAEYAGRVTECRIAPQGATTVLPEKFTTPLTKLPVGATVFLYAAPAGRDDLTLELQLQGPYPTTRDWLSYVKLRTAPAATRP